MSDAKPKEPEPMQTTPKGLPIPIPSREQVAGGLKKIAKPITKSSNDGRPQK